MGKIENEEGKWDKVSILRLDLEVVISCKVLTSFFVLQVFFVLTIF